VLFDLIAVIQENRLTRITLEIGRIFSDMTGELGRLSRDVNDIMEAGRRIEEFAGSVLPGLQMEDLYSQDIDKIRYLVEIFLEKGGDGTADGACVRMVMDKLRKVRTELRSHGDRFTGIIESSRGLSEGVLSKLRGRGGECAGLESIYERFENLRDEFVEGVEAITERKREISRVARGICEIVDLFGGFFTDVSGVARRLEVINMLTRIELARNGGLAGLLGGALTAISGLPAAVKRRAAEAETAYRAVKDGVGTNIAAYRKTIDDQESCLGDIAQSISTISVKLYESRKYFQDISVEMEKSAGDLRAFIDGGSGEIARMGSMVEMLEGIETQRDVSIGEKTVLDGNNREAMMELEKRLTEGLDEGDYRKSMVRSFFREYFDVSGGGEVTFF